jgi:hypothetical protein
MAQKGKQEADAGNAASSLSATVVFQEMIVQNRFRAEDQITFQEIVAEAVAKKFVSGGGSRLSLNC